MSTREYVQMPQDDMAQIRQVEREYCAEPAKGLAAESRLDWPGPDGMW